jgi:hypothetical protein
VKFLCTPPCITSHIYFAGTSTVDAVEDHGSSFKVSKVHRAAEVPGENCPGASRIYDYCKSASGNFAGRILSFAVLGTLGVTQLLRNAVSARVLWKLKEPPTS